MADPLAEKVVQPAVNPEHLAYCPTMDLIALATTDEQIHVYRLNGQKIFDVQKRPGFGKVNRIKWKPNGEMIPTIFLKPSSKPGLIAGCPGQSLATASSNYSVSLTSAHTGKVVHHIDCSAYSKSQISCLGWGINFTDSHKVSVHISNLNGKLSLDDLTSQNHQTKAIEIAPDLPLDLAFLDVEASLPKLSPLSSGGIE